MPSLVLYGPPGSGKTTLARIVANTTGAEFEELSAVSATVSNVREVLARARERLGASGRRTILFLDEIHRFNKAQQDALLPGVEEGLVTLIGATTENPYFELNSALLSRTQFYELEPLSEERPPRGRPPRRRRTRRRRSPRMSSSSSRDAAGGDARTALADPRAAGQTARRRRRCSDRRARRGRCAQAAARLRQERRRPLRLHLGVDQVDARERRAGVDLLPRGHARRRRGPPLHRAPHDRARLRGHRQRRPAGAARRGRRRAGGRARRPAGGAAQPRAGRDLSRARAEVERVVRGAEGSDRGRARARAPAPAGRAALGRLPGCAASSAAARATSTRTTTRPASRSTASPTSSRAASTTRTGLTRRAPMTQVFAGFDVRDRATPASRSR